MSQRIFLGWDQPCLPEVVRWLWQRREDGAAWDLSNLLLVTPGSRAQRRLLELLANQADGCVLIPPRVVTVGALPQELYDADSPVAAPTRALLAWVKVLQEADRTVLAAVTHYLPADDQFAEWLALARDLSQLHSELASHALCFDDAYERITNDPDGRDAPRWVALCRLQQAYESALAAQGFIEVNESRRRAVAAQTCHFDFEIVLIATVELPRITRLMLEQVHVRVTALIHAPDAEADGFDALGALVVEHWSDRPLDVPADCVRVVDRPRDQALEVIRVIGNAQADHDPKTDVPLAATHAPDEVTIGLGDESLSGVIERTLELAGGAAHAPVGRPLRLSPPAVLLDVTARYADSGRFDDLARLLRHPDVDHYMRASLNEQDAMRGIEDWLSLLDEYLTDHLQARPAQVWLGEARRAAQIKAVHDAANALYPQGATSHVATAPSEWTDGIAGLLTRVYSDRPLRHDEPGDDATIIGLESVVQVLGELSELADNQPQVTFPQAVTLVLSRLDALADTPVQPTTSGPGDMAPIELLGWLELALDDAPALIMTGMNEGHVPRAAAGSALLPERTRRLIGLPDSRARFARDAYWMTTILQSRAHVTFIAGRRGPEDDPLVPSRLLLAGAGEQQIDMVQQFYGDDHGPAQPAITLLTPGGQSRFNMVLPAPPVKPITRLSVTAFRDYISCPYRFYLRHVLRLQALDDASVEMDGAAFGTLAHDALDAFGKSDLAHSNDATQIDSFLADRLHRLVRRRFGGEPSAAIVIQEHQLRRRLAAFARFQAKLVDEGWRIDRDRIERSIRAPIQVDAEPFTISGRIDRIDKHDTHGYRIMDYKTADQAKSPNQTHRTGRGGDLQWVDLQLPLYDTLARSVGVTGDITLGYLQLPREVDAVTYDVAEWPTDEIAEAVSLAHDIIRDIRACRFWRPGDPSKYDDGLSELCMDTCTDRQRAILAAGATP